MDKLEMRGVEGNPGNQGLRGFLAVVFSVADHRVADRRELHADLILQPCHQFNSHERSIGKETFDGIAKFGASRFRVFRGAQLLKHSFPPKIVDERSRLSVEMSAQCSKILSYGSVGEKLAHQRLPIGSGFREQQRAGRKTIDAMHDECSFFLQFELCGQQRPRGRSIGALDGHGQKSGGLVENDDGVVFIEHGKFAGKTRPPLVFLRRRPMRGRSALWRSRAAARLLWMFFHWPWLGERPSHYRTNPLPSQCAALCFYQFALLALAPQWCEDTRLQNFRLGSHPVFERLAFGLSALLIKLARAQTHLSFEQFHHQFSAFLIPGYAVHFSIPHNSLCLQLL